MGRGYRTSDYERGMPGNTTEGPMDSAMAPQRNPLSDMINSGIQASMASLGYDTTRRTGEEDNDFYRDNAQYMPGYDIAGIPTGAWTHDRATNHIGHGKGPDNPWDVIRHSLVEREGAVIDEGLAAGGDGHVGFGDVYDAHADAYAESGGGGNQFIDPGAMALAVYATPALEAFGIDSGPFTGASIDLFNDPEDSALEGWSKRMGIGMAETAAGAGMVGAGLYAGRPRLAAAGAGVGALGVGGMLWNTATALGGADTATAMSEQARRGLNVGGSLVEASGVGNLIEGAGSVFQGAVNGASNLLGW